MRPVGKFLVQAGSEADQWAKDPKVEPRMRASLSLLSDMAYRPLTPWTLLTGFVTAAFSPCRKLGDLRISDDGEVAEKVARLKLTLFFALIAASPLACLLAAVILAIGLLAHGSVSVTGDCLSTADDRFLPDDGVMPERA